MDYFVQFSVVPISLMSGETEGITSINHGLDRQDSFEIAVISID